MKPTFTLLTVIVGLSATVKAEDPAPKILRERIEWCDMNVEETGRNDLPRVLFIGDSISAGNRGHAMEAPGIAKPKPVNPNTWIKAETDHTDAIYQCGEKVVFRVSLADKAPSVPAELTWSLTLDGAKVLKQGTLTLPSGTATVEGTLDQPGVLQFKVTPTANVEALGIGMAGAAFEPYRVAPTVKLPADFEEFWNAQKAELAKVPLDVKIEAVPQEGAPVAGEPADAGAHLGPSDVRDAAASDGDMRCSVASRPARSSSMPTKFAGRPANCRSSST